MQDALDVIAEQLAATYPDPDTSGLMVTGRILRLATAIAAARTERLADWDLTVADYDVLATLRRAAPPEGMNPSEVLASVMITSGGMTKRLDRLEERGLLERSPDPDDRRAVRVRLTPAGRRVIDQALPALLAAEAELVRRAIPRAQDRRGLEAGLRALLLEAEGGR